MVETSLNWLIAELPLIWTLWYRNQFELVKSRASPDLDSVVETSLNWSIAELPLIWTLWYRNQFKLVNSRALPDLDSVA